MTVCCRPEHRGPPPLHPSPFLRQVVGMSNGVHSPNILPQNLRPLPRHHGSSISAASRTRQSPGFARALHPRVHCSSPSCAYNAQAASRPCLTIGRRTPFWGSPLRSDRSPAAQAETRSPRTPSAGDQATGDSGRRHRRRACKLWHAGVPPCRQRDPSSLSVVGMTGKILLPVGRRDTGKVTSPLSVVGTTGKILLLWSSGRQGRSSSCRSSG